MADLSRTKPNRRTAKAFQIHLNLQLYVCITVESKTQNMLETLKIEIRGSKYPCRKSPPEEIACQSFSSMPCEAIRYYEHNVSIAVIGNIVSPQHGNKIPVVAKVARLISPIDFINQTSLDRLSSYRSSDAFASSQTQLPEQLLGNLENWFEKPLG
jgi:hypothetical protein